MGTTRVLKDKEESIMAYTKKFREEVLRTLKTKKLSIRKCALLFNIGKNTIVRWKSCIEVKPIIGRPIVINLDELREDVKRYPSDYQYERAKRFGVTQNAIAEALVRAGISYKKKRGYISIQMKRRD